MNIENPRLPENKETYNLPENNIIELDKNSIIFKRHKDYFRGLAEEGIDWPVEIQGSGRSWFKKKQFEVFYPVGDIFLSSAVTLHELGHLRQGEANKSFIDESLGSPNPQKREETDGHHETEQDAWKRGLVRAKRYRLEYLEMLERKFQQYKQQGKFGKFESFEVFYEYVVKVSLKITDINNKIEKRKKLTKLEKGRALGRMIKEDELANDFFTNQEAWKSGEKVDRNLAKEFVKKMAENIAVERY